MCFLTLFCVCVQDPGLDSRFHWQRVMQGHAGANLTPLVASNRVGKEVPPIDDASAKVTHTSHKTQPAHKREWRVV